MHKNGMEDNEKWNLTVGITNCFIGVTENYTLTFPFGICVDYMKLILYNQGVQRFSKNIGALWMT